MTIKDNILFALLSGCAHLALATNLPIFINGCEYLWTKLEK
jgi:hypothetical protein